MNKLIVESKNDKAFVEAVIRHLNIFVKVDEPICLVGDFDCLNGLDDRKLLNAINNKFDDIAVGLKKVGIIIDMDNNLEADKLNMVNKAIKTAYFDRTGESLSATISAINQFIDISIEGSTLQLACYFTNVNGTGELETLLKAIKTKDSTYADCLESWQNCLEDKGKKKVSKKDFDKFWLSNYLRFDTCKNKERGQVERKCSVHSFDYIMKEKAGIFNLDAPELAELKAFLKLFE